MASVIPFPPRRRSCRLTARTRGVPAPPRDARIGQGPQGTPFLPWRAWRCQGTPRFPPSRDTHFSGRRRARGIHDSVGIARRHQRAPIHARSRTSGDSPMLAGTLDPGPVTGLMEVQSEGDYNLAVTVHPQPLGAMIDRWDESKPLELSNQDHSIQQQLTRDWARSTADTVLAQRVSWHGPLLPALCTKRTGWDRPPRSKDRTSLPCGASSTSVSLPTWNHAHGRTRTTEEPGVLGLVSALIKESPVQNRPLQRLSISGNTNSASSSPGHLPLESQKPVTLSVSAPPGMR
jgi:hypothetical protein